MIRQIYLDNIRYKTILLMWQKLMLRVIIFLFVMRENAVHGWEKRKDNHKKKRILETVSMLDWVWILVFEKKSLDKNKNFKFRYS